MARAGSPYWAHQLVQTYKMHKTTELPGWRLLGHGMTRRVYRRPRGAFVYKLEVAGFSTGYQNRLENVRIREYREEGFSWVPEVATLYEIEPNFPVMVMPYYPGEVTDEIAEQFSFSCPVNDVHDDNVRYRKNGTIVVIDYGNG